MDSHRNSVHSSVKGREFWNTDPRPIPTPEEWEAVLAEVKRLRAALGVIANEFRPVGEDDGEIARRALEGPTADA